jgi:hypothetical protein
MILQNHAIKTVYTAEHAANTLLGAGPGLRGELVFVQAVLVLGRQQRVQKALLARLNSCTWLLVAATVDSIMTFLRERGCRMPTPEETS